jgi:hypothetical protein
MIIRTPSLLLPLFVLRLLVCGFRSFAPGIRRELYGIAPGFLDIVQCALHQINEV